MITILLNVRIADESKFMRLKALLDTFESKEIFRIVLRVRGNFRGQNEWIRMFSGRNIHFFFESTYKDWKLDLLEQMNVYNSNFYLLLQEDHLLVCSEESLLNLVEEFQQLKLDFMPLSFFPHGLPFTNFLDETETIKYSGNFLRSWKLSKNLVKRTPSFARIYPVSLVGIISKYLLATILISERPLIKSYSSQTPFNFEQPPKACWYLPIWWGYPRFEIFGCVDVDHGIPGYSLISRGLYFDSVSYLNEHHHSKGFTKKLFEIAPGLEKLIPPALQVVPRKFRYTADSGLSFMRRMRIKNDLMKFS